MKNINKIFLGAAVLVAVIIIIYYGRTNTYIFSGDRCYINLLDDLEASKYKTCSADSECKTISVCGQCVNPEGEAMYYRVKPICIPLQLACVQNKGCACVNNTCIEQGYVE